MKLCLIVFIPAIIFGQNLISFSNSPVATGMSNGGKIFSFPHLYSETLHCVFQKNDSICYARSTDGGTNWQTNLVLPGRNPSIYLSPDGFRHIVWEKDTAGNSEIYYYCLDIRSPPRNISQTPGKSYLPSLFVDSNSFWGGAHIVWADSSFGKSRIYYRKLDSDTFQITNFDTPQVQDHSYPTIGCFEQGRIYVFWQCYNSQNLIYSRYLESDTWADPMVIDSSASPLLHPSCDLTGGEDFSLGYEDYRQGNPDCRFYGGNGGGYSTQGVSTYPVLSTIGYTWSYLAWMEDNADICLHLYYFMSGWSSFRLRSLFQIQEKTTLPNFYGAHLIWTQGDSSPYKVMYHFFGYPIGISEAKRPEGTETQQYAGLPSSIRRLKSAPTTFRFQSKNSFIATIYNINGSKIKEITSNNGAAIWDGKDRSGKRVNPGIYIIKIKGEKERSFKVILY